jgi:hypothetical protein
LDVLLSTRIVESSLVVCNQASRGRIQDPLTIHACVPGPAACLASERHGSQGLHRTSDAHLKRARHLRAACYLCLERWWWSLNEARATCGLSTHVGIDLALDGWLVTTCTRGRGCRALQHCSGWSRGWARSSASCTNESSNLACEGRTCGGSDLWDLRFFWQRIWSRAWRWARATSRSSRRRCGRGWPLKV